MMKICFVTFVSILGFNQAMFVGIYSAIRLPAAFGVISAKTYLSKTPTMSGGYYEVCRFINRNLKNGETYYSGLVIPAYYCPQQNMYFKRLPNEIPWYLGDGQFPEYTRKEFIGHLEKADFKYMMFMTSYTSRRDMTEDYTVRQNTTAPIVTISIDDMNYRFKQHVGAILPKLSPNI